MAVTQLLLQLPHVGERYGNDILNPVAGQGELLLLVLLMRHQLSMLLLLLRCNCCCQLILQWSGTLIESWLRFGIAVDRRVLLLRLRLWLRLWRLAERALIQFQLLWHSETEAMRLLMLLQLQLLMMLMLMQMLLVLRELHWTRQHSMTACSTWWTVANVVVVVTCRLYVIVLQLEALVKLS